MRNRNAHFLYFFLLFFFSFSQFIFAMPDEDVPKCPNEMLLNEPSCFVNQTVNVITGNYHENEIDLEVAGPHPLFFQRSYVSNNNNGSLCYQWNTNHVGEVYKPNLSGTRESTGTVHGDCGTIIEYEGTTPRNKRESTGHLVHKDVFRKYMTNCPDCNNAPGSHLKTSTLLYNKKYKSF